MSWWDWAMRLISMSIFTHLAWMRETFSQYILLVLWEGRQRTLPVPDSLGEWCVKQRKRTKRENRENLSAGSGRRERAVMSMCAWHTAHQLDTSCLPFTLQILPRETTLIAKLDVKWHIHWSEAKTHTCCTWVQLKFKDISTWALYKWLYVSV